MEDAAFLVEGFAVTIALGFRIETVGNLVLCFWRESLLVFDHHYGFLVEFTLDGVEVGL